MAYLKIEYRICPELCAIFDEMKVILIEDEGSLAESILVYLKKEGYLCEVATNYSSAEDKALMNDYDCALVDLGIPGGTGLEIVNLIRRVSPRTGIIIISAKNSLEDKIHGLDIGADDYLSKPFHLAELNSRIKSVLRRSSFSGNQEIVIGNIVVKPESREVRVNNEPITLTKSEFSLLLFFISNSNRVLTKEAIAGHLMGEESDMADSFDFVYSHIKNLRRKLSDELGADVIVSIYGMGYKLVPV